MPLHLHVHGFRGVSKLIVCCVGCWAIAGLLSRIDLGKTVPRQKSLSIYPETVHPHQGHRRPERTYPVSSPNPDTSTWLIYLCLVGLVMVILAFMQCHTVPDRIMSLQVVARHIMTEYNRTAVIAHLSQPTSAHQEGWGQPGQSWILFEREIRPGVGGADDVDGREQRRNSEGSISGRG